jgi:formamidopyrimidine-DNA glycosylase
MPELPELELARRNVERWLAGRRVVDAQAEEARTFRGAWREAFEQVRGRLEFAKRRGKNLLLGFEGNRGLHLHFGMTGKLVRRLAGVVEPYSRARLSLDDGSVIHFRDPRLFGRIEPKPADALLSAPGLLALGPDALDEPLSGPRLALALSRTRRPLKVALMDQALLAGLGNLHVAEALFRARLHPARAPASLSQTEWRALAAAIRKTLAFALETQGGDEVQYLEDSGALNPFFVYGRAGEPCRTCGAAVESFPQSGRTTFFCPKCQPQPRSKR